MAGLHGSTDLNVKNIEQKRNETVHRNGYSLGFSATGDKGVYLVPAGTEAEMLTGRQRV